MERVTHTCMVQIWDTRGHRARGRDCGVSLEWVTHTRRVQYVMPWVTGGMMYSIGRGCNGISYAFLQCGYNRGFTLSGGCMQNSFCRFGKISLGFCNQTFLQYGCKRYLSHSRDVCWAPSADLGKSRWGLAIMHPCQVGVKWGSMAGLHQLS